MDAAGVCQMALLVSQIFMMLYLYMQCFYSSSSLLDHCTILYLKSKLSLVLALFFLSFIN